MQKFHFSLASLFGSIVVAAVGCAALARPTEAWTKTALSMSLGLLLLALLKLSYGERLRRAFWGGFAIVGWGYLLAISLLAPFQGTSEPQLATSALLRMLARAVLGSDPLFAHSSPSGFPASGYDPYYDSATEIPVESDLSVRYPPQLSAVAPTEIPPLPAPPEAADDPAAPAFEPEAPATSSNAGSPSATFYPTPVVATITVDPGAWLRFMQIGQYLWAIVLGMVGGLLASCVQVRTARLESKAPAGDKPAGGG